MTATAYESFLPPMWKNIDFNPLPLVVSNKTRVGEFSFFSRPVQNIYPQKVINVYDLYLLIKGHQYAPQTHVLRTLQNPAFQRNYKAAQFDYVTPAGIFARRANASLLSHSQLIVIDFDHLQAPSSLKRNLITDPIFKTALAFISPSGHGVKWLVEIDTDEYTHLQWFTGIQNYIKRTYDIEVDKSGKDVSRCCFIPYDPAVYIHPDYIPDHE